MISSLYQVLNAVVVISGISSGYGYLEMSSALRILNIPWEGKCPVYPALQFRTELPKLGYLGKCPTVYKVTELVPGSEPSAVLEGFCDPSCQNSVCGTFGDFRCRNYTVPLDVKVPTLTAAEDSDDLQVTTLSRSVYISVGCFCQFRKSTKLTKHEPQTVE